jgi:hypothetical protein
LLPEVDARRRFHIQNIRPAMSPMPAMAPTTTPANVPGVKDPPVELLLPLDPTVMICADPDGLLTWPRVNTFCS